ERRAHTVSQTSATTAAQSTSWAFPVPQASCPGSYRIVDQHPVFVLDDLPHFGNRRWHGNRPLIPRQVRGLLPLLPPGTVLRLEMGGSRGDPRCFCSPQAGLTQRQQVRQRYGGIGGDGQVDSLETLIVGGPTAHQKIAHGNMDDLRLRTDGRL